MFRMRQYVVFIRSVRNGSLLNLFVSTSQIIICVGLFKSVVLNVCVSGADVLTDFRILFLCQFGSLRVCSVKLLLVFDRESTFEIFYVIYILVGFSHVSMVITRPIKVLGWCFHKFPLWKLYCVNLCDIDKLKLST